DAIHHPGIVRGCLAISPAQVGRGPFIVAGPEDGGHSPPVVQLFIEASTPPTLGASRGRAANNGPVGIHRIVAQQPRVGKRFAAGNSVGAGIEEIVRSRNCLITKRRIKMSGFYIEAVTDWNV